MPDPGSNRFTLVRRGPKVYTWGLETVIRLILKSGRQPEVSDFRKLQR